MKLYKKLTSRTRQAVFLAVLLLFALGVFLVFRATVWSRDAVNRERDKHLFQLASSVDHNIGIVLNRCRVELSGLVSSASLREAERAFDAGEDHGELKERLKTSAVLLTDYAERIIVQKGETTLLSTRDNDALRYSILCRNSNDDIWLCEDKESGKSYLALSCPSETNENVFYVLVDLEPFFRRVVVDTIYEDYWIVLYDMESGLTLQNDSGQPEYAVFSDREIAARDDGYTRIRERELSGEAGVSKYGYTPDTGGKQNIRIYVIPSKTAENGIFATAVAVYNEHSVASAKKIAAYNVLAAALMAFSAAAAVFMFLHNGKREQELAQEIAVLRKEKQLGEEILRQQEQIMHRQKLETIGTMTAGIAHEFNNLLSPIMGNSMLILEKSRTDAPELFDSALEIYNASDRAKELISKISRLSRKQPDEKMLPLRPRKLIDDILSMAASSIPGNIAIEKDIRTDKKILGDESQLGYMLLNLVINAVQAMKPDDGTLTITVDAPDDKVCIGVADTGTGIPEENFPVIFDPFFTTKSAGKGTGLGLPIAQKIATNHGGTIRAENLPQGGAKFTFETKALEE